MSQKEQESSTIPQDTLAPEGFIRIGEQVYSSSIVRIAQHIAGKTGESLEKVLTDITSEPTPEERAKLDSLHPDLPSLKDMSPEEFIEKYGDIEAIYEEKYARIKNAHPLHPTTGEPGTFVRFSRQYPIYQTPSGDEFIVQRGVPRLLRT